MKNLKEMCLKKKDDMQVVLKQTCGGAEPEGGTARREGGSSRGITKDGGVYYV